MITHLNKYFSKHFLSVNNIIMSSQGNIINLLKQLLLYGKTIEPEIKKFTNTKLLLVTIFGKPIKVKIKQLSI